jgi:hypothetical protein
MGVTVVSVVVLTAVAGAAGFMAVSAGVLILAAGAAAAAVGALAAAATGVLAGSEGVLTVAAGAAAGAAAAAAQWSEIMFTSVMAKPLSAAAGSNPLALFPMTVTSWPRCGLRSTLLVVILKMCPVLSSTTV